MLIINILMNALYFEIFLWHTNFAEWIDMPQFSDEKKVYRVSSLKQDHFYKFAQESTADQFPYEYQSITHKDLAVTQTTINETRGQTSYEFEDLNDSENLKHSNEEDITSTKKYDEEMESVSEGYSSESLISNDTDILKYLPVDVLKSVHYTLKLQPTSSEGKILFLETFKKTLMTEIEYRLIQSMTATREKRGAEHYDHYGSDYHEHATGFPSIEGALMAISFLTFAVYLVRLVMLLFRNMNNPTPNTTLPTLLLGRRKKSIDIFDEDMIKIFDAVENFSSNFK